MVKPLWLTFWQSPPAAFLENAFNEKLSEHVKLEQFRAAKAELTVDLRRFPRLRRLAKQEPKLAQALILLHAHAAKHKRKIDGTPSYLHTCEVAEDFLKATRKIIVTPEGILNAAMKVILHDGIEDFDMTGHEIEALFGDYILQRTLLVTSPETAQLALDFPQILVSHGIVLPKEAKIDAIRRFLHFLEQNNPAGYEVLRTDLKIAHKCKIAEEYMLDEAIYRAIDNAHSLLSDARNIEAKKLFITRPNEGSSLPASTKTRTLKAALQNRTNRRLCNDAILTRVRTMQASTGLSPQEKLKFDAASKIISRYFNTVATRYGRALRHPLDRQSSIAEAAALTFL